MKKLKKMLILSSLSVLISSCADKRLPEMPELHRYGPVWKKTEDNRDVVVHWSGFSTKTEQSWKINNTDARSKIMLCMDAESYQRSEEYIAELERLAKKRCQ